MKVTAGDIIRLERKYGFVIADKKFAEDLLKLEKQENMKITENTTLKELIPEGYEFDYCNGKPTNEGKKTEIHIHFKKKPVKDFNWYTETYRNKTDPHLRFALTLAVKYWDFEYRIGLFKFICDDLKIDWRRCLWGDTAYILESEIDKVKSICPEEFLNSLI